MGTAPIVHSSVDRSFERDAVFGKVLSRVLHALVSTHVISWQFICECWVIQLQIPVFNLLRGVLQTQVIDSVTTHHIELLTPNFNIFSSVFSMIYQKCRLFLSPIIYSKHTLLPTNHRFTFLEEWLWTSYLDVNDEWLNLFIIFFLFLFINSLPSPNTKTNNITSKMLA